MRVLQVIPSVSQVHGGPSIAIWEIAHGLRQSGASTAVLTTDHDGRGQRLSLEQANELAVGIPIVVKPVTTEFYTSSWQGALWLLRNLRNYDVVQVHALFSFMPVFAALVARWYHVPFVVRPLGTLAAYGLTERRPLLKRVSVALLERPLLRAAKAVHCTSLTEAIEVEAVCPGARTVVVPLSIRSVESVSRTAVAALRTELGEGPVVLFLSRLDPKKNVETLLRSIEHVVKFQSDALFVIAGSGDEAYARSLQTLASELGVERHTRWLGYVEGDRKATLLATARVFVLPSFAENFGIAVGEALAAGVPCVVTPGVAIAEDIVTAGAGVVVDANATAVAAGILHFLRSDEVRENASYAAQELAGREYSRERLGQRLMDMYENIGAIRNSNRRRPEAGGAPE